VIACQDVPVDVRLDHVVIHVSDWQRSNAFYSEVVGVEVIERGPGYAYRLGDQQLNCPRARGCGRSPRTTAGCTGELRPLLRLARANRGGASPSAEVGRGRRGGAGSTRCCPWTRHERLLPRSRRIAAGVHVLLVEPLGAKLGPARFQRRPTLRRDARIGLRQAHVLVSVLEAAAAIDATGGRPASVRCPHESRSPSA
jgi:catechol 2,3-dioxygenase-like lactoylglutathione lyase family enzyme